MALTMRPRVLWRKAVVAALAVMLMAVVAAPAAGHELRPTIAEFQETGAVTGSVTYRMVLTVNLEALIAQIGPEHDDTSQSAQAGEYDRLRRLDPGALETAFGSFESRLLAGITLAVDGARQQLRIGTLRIPAAGDVDLARISYIELKGILPEGAGAFTWTWDKSFGAIAIRVRGLPDADGGTAPVVFATFLQPGQTSKAIPLGTAPEQALFDVVVQYMLVGFLHIVPLGLDHILFVVGLFLLSVRLSALVWQISSFTVAHTATLALGMLGVVQIPSAIVEPLIAASIVYVGVENILTDRLRRWRTALVFCFGLLHGLGFAGVLDEIGVQPAHFVTGLIAFNLGVELGQLTVVAGCFAVAGYWFASKPWYRRRVTIPASIAISMIGAWWFLERTLL